MMGLRNFVIKCLALCAVVLAAEDDGYCTKEECKETSKGNKYSKGTKNLVKRCVDRVNIKRVFPDFQRSMKTGVSLEPR